MTESQDQPVSTPRCWSYRYSHVWISVVSSHGFGEQNSGSHAWAANTLPLEPSLSFRHRVGGPFSSNHWALTWHILWSMGPLLQGGYAYTTFTTSCCLPTHMRCCLLYCASLCNSWVYTCILMSCLLPICIFEHYHFNCRGFLIYFNIWGCKFSQTLVFFVQTFMLLFTHSEINFIIILYSSRKKKFHNDISTAFTLNV